MKYIIVAICFICLFSQAGIAQSKKRNANSSSDTRGTTTYESGAESSIFSDSKKGASKSKYAGKTTGDLKKEYYARMEANGKKYEKMSKDMEKPQYADPSYFGHKKKPSKHRIAKKKFCKECGIRH